MPDSFEQLKAHFDRIAEKNREDHAALRTRLAEAEAALQRAREALKAFGRHAGGCPDFLFDGSGCTCGLDAALKDEVR